MTYVHSLHDVYLFSNRLHIFKKVNARVKAA